MLLDKIRNVSCFIDLTKTKAYYSQMVCIFATYVFYFKKQFTVYVLVYYFKGIHEICYPICEVKCVKDMGHPQIKTKPLGIPLLIGLLGIIYSPDMYRKYLRFFFWTFSILLLHCAL